jgi:hypothetical protein
VLAEGWNDGANHGDRYLREAMFGPEHPRAIHTLDLNTQLSERDSSLPGFGPFGTAGKQCFDPDSPAYLRIMALCAARRRHAVLRIGRQYARQIRLPFTGFEFPAAGEILAWSRILDNQEAVVVVNSNGDAERGGDVVVTAELSGLETEFTVVANTAQSATASYTGSHPIGSKLQVKGRTHPDEPAFIEIRSVKPAEVLVLIREF